MALVKNQIDRLNKQRQEVLTQLFNSESFNLWSILPFDLSCNFSLKTEKAPLSLSNFFKCSSCKDIENLIDVDKYKLGTIVNIEHPDFKMYNIMINKEKILQQIFFESIKEGSTIIIIDDPISNKILMSWIIDVILTTKGVRSCIPIVTAYICSKNVFFLEEGSVLLKDFNNIINPVDLLVQLCIIWIELSKYEFDIFLPNIDNMSILALKKPLVYEYSFEYNGKKVKCRVNTNYKFGLSNLHNSKIKYNNREVRSTMTPESTTLKPMKLQNRNVVLVPSLSMFFSLLTFYELFQLLVIKFPILSKYWDFCFQHKPTSYTNSLLHQYLWEEGPKAILDSIFK